MKWTNIKLVVIAAFLLVVGAVTYRYTFDLQRSSQAIYVVLHNELDYANSYYNKSADSSLGSKSKQPIVYKTHLHNFTIDVGGGESYSGESYLYNGSVIVLIDSPKTSGWFFTDPSGQKHGECKKLFGSDGTEEAVAIRWKNICALNTMQ